MRKKPRSALQAMRDAVISMPGFLRLVPVSFNSINNYKTACNKDFSLVSYINNTEPPLPPTPTQALPGSWEKVEVMRKRAASGYAIFHPDDAQLD